MTVADLVILPGILVAAFLGAILWVILRLANRKIRLMRAGQTAAEVPVRLLGQQALIVSDVINELEVNHLSYTGFPPELKDRLLDLHAEWMNARRKGIT